MSASVSPTNTVPFTIGYLHLGGGRRVVFYSAGGWNQERFVPGPGWVVASEEDWTEEVKLAVWDSLRVLKNVSADLMGS
jgi:hypothetical protein